MPADLTYSIGVSVTAPRFERRCYPVTPGTGNTSCPIESPRIAHMLTRKQQETSHHQNDFQDDCCHCSDCRRGGWRHVRHGAGNAILRWLWTMQRCVQGRLSAVKMRGCGGRRPIGWPPLFTGSRQVAAPTLRTSINGWISSSIRSGTQQKAAAKQPRRAACHGHARCRRACPCRQQTER